MSNSYYNYQAGNADYNADSLRLEAVVVSVGFDDLLAKSLSHNTKHLDTTIVVTSHDDVATQNVARDHGAIVVVTDLFEKNGRNFNKGAAINAGFGHFQYHGWRMCLDADIVLPDNFRRVLFNHTTLDRSCIYGCDRIDVIGDEIDTLHTKKQSLAGYAIHPAHDGPTAARYHDNLHGYVPIGYFQLWNASRQRSYPYSLGSAAHDDVLFAIQWPDDNRRLLPSAWVYHICAQKPKTGENWDGNRQQPRID